MSGQAVSELDPRIKAGRIAAGLGGFVLGTVAAVANSMYRSAIGTAAEADMSFGLVAFLTATALVGAVAVVGIGSFAMGKRWWGLWAFVGGYLAAFGTAGFISDIGSLS